MSCVDELEEVVDSMRHEWKRKGGNKLEVSELRCLETALAMVLFNVYNEEKLNGIRAEAVRLMKGAGRHEKDVEMDIDTGGVCWSRTSRCRHRCRRFQDRIRLNFRIGTGRAPINARLSISGAM